MEYWNNGIVEQWVIKPPAQLMCLLPESFQQIPCSWFRSRLYI